MKSINWWINFNRFNHPHNLFSWRIFLGPSPAWTGPLPVFLTGKNFAFPTLTSFLSAFGRQKWTLRSTAYFSQRKPGTNLWLNLDKQTKNFWFFCYCWKMKNLKKTVFFQKFCSSFQGLKFESMQNREKPAVKSEICRPKNLGKSSKYFSRYFSRIERFFW